mmetsp:Transcript_6850/g.17531  ORF Transcript_6850/g.17531 Transcript_6850/m.17531 type:complete len:160 (-) Transcript_6850:108-587(-)
MCPGISVTDIVTGIQYVFPIPCFYNAYWRQLLKSYSERVSARGFEHEHDVEALASFHTFIPEFFTSGAKSATATTKNDYAAPETCIFNVHEFSTIFLSSASAKGKTQIEAIAQHFHKPINVAARDMNICATVLKKICRRHGLDRWPSRKVLFCPSLPCI